MTTAVILKVYCINVMGVFESNQASESLHISVADPGFPEGGADPLGGAKVRHGDVAEN